MFLNLTARDAQDESAFAGLGEAEFDLADYAVARNALATALRLNPNDTTVQKRLDATGQILALDPTLRGLGESERLKRSQSVLAAILDLLDQCPPTLAGRLEATRWMPDAGCWSRPGGQHHTAM